MQAVYMVRPGDENPELRWSLRSLRHCIPITEVVTVGHRPAWLRPDLHIDVPFDDGRTKYEQVRHQIETALDHPDVARRWSLWNDDFYCLRPAAELPHWHLGPIEARATSWRPGAYRELMETTLGLLRVVGCSTTWLYATHTPMVIGSEGLAAALEVEDRHGVRTLTRSLYGNLAELGGLEVDDVKLTSHHDAPDLTRGWLSTADTNCFAVRRELARRFPARSRWETR